ncbi:MAG: hypothetical protein V2J14_04255 [Erythrobacter sp.]|nr:hypothetical protein [Erythrobacter sp.]
MALALSACGDDAADTAGDGSAETGGTVSGDIRGGTISDAMIPLEQLRSQSPPLERPTGSPSPTGGEAEAGEAPAEEDGAESETGAAPEDTAPAE